MSSPRPVADRPRIAVVGGGLSGLVAAYQLHRDLPGAAVTVYEAGRRPGGKLDTDDFPSGPMELGAEAFIRRRAEAFELVCELGLEPALHHPSGLGSAVLSGGRLHPMPAGTMMGLPGEANLLAGLLSDREVARAAAEEHLPLDWRPGQDVSLGELVVQRYGPAVLHRLVDPMLGGVYAAPSAGLGLRAVVPGLAARLDAGAPSLTAAVRQLRGAPAPGPVFATFDGGYRTFVDTLAAAGGAQVRTGHTVTAVDRVDEGYRLSVRGSSGTTPDTVDAVVVAVPVPQAAPLLRGLSTTAGEALASVRTASSAVVAMEVDRRLELPRYSGVLVATDEEVPFKAITFSSRKWPHLDSRPGHLLRVSFGRLGADEMLAADDRELTGMAERAVATTCGGTPAVLHSTVRRWDDGLPEIGPGHDGLIEAIRSDLLDHAPRVELVGAATEGVGVPACIGSARAAARRLCLRWQD